MTPGTRTYTLGLEQSCPPSPGQLTKEPYVIPVAMGLVGRDGQSLPLQLEGESAPVGNARVLVSTNRAASSPSSTSTSSRCRRCCAASRRRWCCPTTCADEDLHGAAEA